MNPHPYLLTTLACLFGTLLLATPSAATDIVIYKMAQSGRFLTYEQSLNEEAPSSEGRKQSEMTRQYIIHHRPTDTFRDVSYFNEKTPEGRLRNYRAGPNDRSFTAVLETNYEDSRNELVLSILGTGAGTSYFENATRQAAVVETLVGRLKNQRIKTVLAGTIDVVVPSVLKGDLIFEAMNRNDDVNLRELTTAKESLKLDKKLTGAVFGLSLEQAQDAVVIFLESKGYVPQS